MKITEIIEGSLLGDGTVSSYKGKYFTFKIVGKDQKFLEWVAKSFNMSGINCWISRDNVDIFSMGFYINSCPYRNFINLRENWYKADNKKSRKIVPNYIRLTPISLLFWYLGDGSLIRRKEDENRIPFIVLATNCFSKEDIDFLLEKLKEFKLNFYPVKYKSGFTGKECGYCLYSNTEDGTPFRFFKLIGLECPQEIANCTTGKKGIYHEEKFFRDKWPRTEDWIKVLSKIKEVGAIIRGKRKELNLTQKQLSQLIGVSREHIKNIELGRNSSSVPVFRKILNALNLNVDGLLTNLNTPNLVMN